MEGGRGGRREEGGGRREEGGKEEGEYSITREVRWSLVGPAVYLSLLAIGDDVRLVCVDEEGDVGSWEELHPVGDVLHLQALRLREGGREGEGGEGRREGGKEREGREGGEGGREGGKERKGREEGREGRRGR